MVSYQFNKLLGLSIHDARSEGESRHANECYWNKDSRRDDAKDDSLEAEGEVKVTTTTLYNWAKRVVVNAARHGHCLSIVWPDLRLSCGIVL